MMSPAISFRYKYVIYIIEYSSTNAQTIMLSYHMMSSP